MTITVPPERSPGEIAALDGLPGGRGLNIAHEAVDRHVRAGRGGRVALAWHGRRDERREVTYAELSEKSDRFANALGGLGVGRGDAVFLLLERVPELYVAALGTWKNLSILSPLFPLFGPEPVRQRLRLGHGRALVTTEALYRHRVAPVRNQLPELDHVLIAGPVTARSTEIPGAVALDEVLAAAPRDHEIPDTDPETPAIYHFTSGTTGTPKGAVHVHGAVTAHHATGSLALDLRAGDVFWCTADPGWVTGTSYGIISPLTHGATLVVDQGDFDAERWYRILAGEQVNVWYTAPTAVRRLRQHHRQASRGHGIAPRRLPHLRFVASVGEPLDPGAVLWARQAWGTPIHDGWWQTETGAIMIANTPGMEIRPGSMGRPLPGVVATILARDPDDVERPLRHDGHLVEVADPGTAGHLALRSGWPSMFRDYIGDPERYRRCFVDGWYITGDIARRDAQGYYWFVCRADDVIKSAGHLIGPIEIEQVLVEHPAVGDAAAIGVPDPVAGEIVKAFVALAPGHEPSGALVRELIGFARSRLGPAVAPREIAIEASIPHNRSGKVMRRLLKRRELGLDPGDVSTMEAPP